MLINTRRKSNISITVLTRWITVLVLLIPLFIQGKAVNMADSTYLRISTEYDGDLRRIKITIPAKGDEKLIIRPDLTMNASEGHFKLTYTPVDTTGYLGNYKVLDRGLFPLSLAISFHDSVTLVIAGKTIPYQDLTHYYDFGSESYLVDLYMGTNTEMANNKTGSDLSLRGPILNTSHKQSSVTKTGWLSPTLVRAAGYSSLFAVTIFTLLIIFKYFAEKQNATKMGNKKKSLSVKTKWRNVFSVGLQDLKAMYALMQEIFKPRSFANKLSPKTNQLVDGIRIEKDKISPELLDKKIHSVADELNISYDEAVLRVSMQSKGFDKT